MSATLSAVVEREVDMQAPSVAGGGRLLAFNALAGSAANVAKIGVQLVMLPLMAHLLGPSEFGLYALALPTVSFCMILADGGLAASLAREPLESVLVWSTSFWLVLAVGIALSVSVIGWGYALAALSHEARVSQLTNILSPALIMISVSALPSARLTREAKLAIFAAADVISTVAGASVAVAMAMTGFGAKSLAAQYLFTYTLRAIILNGEAFVRPRWQFQFSALSSHLSMGSALLGVKMADFLGRMVENLLYGRAFGAGGLGVYTFANQAPRFICEAASGPIWAALYAFALREPRHRLPDMHVKLTRLLSALVFPAAALLSATAPEILAIILGPNWKEAGELLRLLVPFYALNVVSGQTGAVLLAKGHGWLLFGLSLFLTLGRVAAVSAGFFLSSTWVALGVDAALALYSLAMFAATGHPDGFRRLMMAATPPIIAATLAGAAALAAVHIGGLHLYAVVVAWLAGGIVYFIFLALLMWRTLGADLQEAKKALKR